jgi:transcriptional regulator with XRE-family HTH domain
MSIGEKITAFRKRKGFSQEEMAERLGMTPQGYGKIERGDTDVNYSRLEQIAKELETNVEEVVGFGEKNNFSNSNLNNISNSTLNVNADKELLHEIEKLKLENEKLKLEVSYLKKIVEVSGITIP